jgi:glycosyltransferase involved in cell wall biosynthesis
MDEWAPRAKRDWTAGSPFVVRYVGSIVADGQRDGLRDVAAAVDGLRRTGTAVELWVHAPREQSASLVRDGQTPREGLRLGDPPDPDRIHALLASADLLVLPFNFDARSARYIRFSMPTKIPAYMASGAPILLYGPPGIAAVRYAERDGWARVVVRSGVEALGAALAGLMGDQAAREALGRRAQALARERHDAATVRPAFQAALMAAAAAGRREPAAPVRSGPARG